VSTFDLGDVVPLGVETRDTEGDLANATTVVVTITLPDGSTSGPHTVSPTSTGIYQYDYTPSQVGRHGVRWVATGTNAGAFTDVFDVLDNALLPIVSLADAKRHLNITATTDDEELRRTLAVATDAAERYANRALRRKTVSETHDGGSPVLILRQPPVASVSSVTVGGVATTAYVLDAAAGLLYAGTDGGSTWTAGWQNIVVTYVTSATVPEVAEQAVLELTRHLWEQQQQGYRPGLGVVDGDVYAPGAAFAFPRRVTELLDQVRYGGIA